MLDSPAADPALPRGREFRRRARVGLGLSLALSALLGGCMSTKEPLKPVSHVDLARYMGDWFVIAEIPYFAEKDCVDSIESYALRPSGGIDNWFTCRKKSFDAPMKRRASARASVVDPRSNATWRIWFFGIVPVKYLILDLDPGYRWVAVGHPSRRYGWIMSRDKTLDDSTYQRILRDLGTQGYDTSKFQRVPQASSVASALHAARPQPQPQPQPAN